MYKTKLLRCFQPRVAGNAGSMHLNKMEVNMNIDSRGNWMSVSYTIG